MCVCVCVVGGCVVGVTLCPALDERASSVECEVFTTTLHLVSGHSLLQRVDLYRINGTCLEGIWCCNMSTSMSNDADTVRAGVRELEWGKASRNSYSMLVAVRVFPFVILLLTVDRLCSMLARWWYLLYTIGGYLLADCVILVSNSYGFMLTLIWQLWVLP